jgi:hypothetical protein
MNIKSTKCKLNKLSQKQIDSLIEAMPKDGLFDFGHGEGLIGFSSHGRSGTWIEDGKEIIISYTEMMQLLKPEWTIYNNTLPWSQLSDKQKGKMLLAQNNKLKFESFTLSGPTMPFSKGWVYVVEKPEATMEELFHSDFYGLGANGSIAEQMVAKGWVKK